MHLVIHGSQFAQFSQLSTFITWVVLIGAVYGFLRMLRDLWRLAVAIMTPPEHPPER